MVKFELKKVTLQQKFQQGKEVKGFLKAKLPGDVTGYVSLVPQTNAAVLEAEHKNWEVKYDTKNEILNVMGKFKIDKGFSKDTKVKVSQEIVKGDFSVFPALKYEAETTLFSRNKVEDKFKISYDTYKRKVAAKEVVEFKVQDVKNKVSVDVDSSSGWKGSKLEWKAELNEKWVDSVGAVWSDAGGVVLKSVLKPRKGYKVEADYVVKTNKLDAQLEIAPGNWNGAGLAIRHIQDVSKSVDKGTTTAALFYEF